MIPNMVTGETVIAGFARDELLVWF